MSALTNVAVPLLLAGRDRRAAKRSALECLKACGVDGAADARPDELSDAERRRVAIARAIATGPRVILADEPTSGLGFAERDSVLHLLQAVAREDRVAVLIADATITGVMRAGNLLFLEGGELRWGGPEPYGELIHFPDVEPVGTDA